MRILIDVGGTKTRIAVSDGGKNFGEPFTLNTPKHFEEAISFFKTSFRELLPHKIIDAVVMGVPGVLDFQKTKLLRAPHLPFWENKLLKATFEHEFRAPLSLYNDAALGALGEAVYGAGKEFNVVGYWTISTGIGGARVTKKKIDISGKGFEPGHQMIAHDNGWHTLDSLAGGAALIHRYGPEFWKKFGPKEWEELHIWLAAGIHNSLVHWSPEVFVLGGPGVKNENIRIDTLVTHLKKSLTIFPDLPPIKKGVLGDKAGLFGALAVSGDLAS